ncbi:CoA ester lyase, partial [Azospirillum brasilense]|nr:CoA ester lyase [Azospirillum brasilense]
MALPYRSYLFVPADNAKLLEKAHQRGADALILDLWDPVRPPAKPEARPGLPPA